MSAVKVIDDPVRPFFTVRTLAEYLQVSERMVRYLLVDELPSVKVGKERRIYADVVDAWVARHRQTPSGRRRRISGYEDWDADERAYAEILRRDPCCYCGAPTEAVDHIEPLACGGAHGWDNFTAACGRCNSGKRDRPLLTYLLGKANR